MDEWIKDGQEGDDDYTTLQMPLKATLAQLTTELILKRNNLLNSNTAALSQNAVSLISYICSNCVDWNNDVNIGIFCIKAQLFKTILLAFLD